MLLQTYYAYRFYANPHSQEKGENVPSNSESLGSLEIGYSRMLIFL